MAKPAAAVLGLLTSWALSAPLWGKSPLALIEVKGTALKSPVRIVDAKSLRAFNFFDGPGLNCSELKDCASGSIIDWKSGAVAQPSTGRQRYQVSMYTDCEIVPKPFDCVAGGPHLVYFTFFDRGSSGQKGFIYLPGRGEPWYGLNVSTLYRPGVDGHWFVATDSWMRFIVPAIAKALERRELRQQR